MHDLRDAVVVITGASSGIGRATARAFAARGARVVLAARRADPLAEAARECEALGAPRALAVTTDVTDEAQVAALAAEAERAFGRVDVWVNNVGTGVFGPYADAPAALHRKVVEANLVGAMHGASAILPVFLRQRRGVMVNVVSVGGWAPVPFAAAYSASKAGLRAFTAALRQELKEAAPGVRVCGVFPATVDTPGFEHGANVSGRELRLGGPIYRAEDVAEAIVGLAQHPRDEVAVGWPARAAQVAYALFPGAAEHATGAMLRRYLRRAAPAPRTEGAILAPVPQGTTTSGGWRARKTAESSGAISWGVAGAAVLALGAAAAYAAASRRRRSAWDD